MKGKRNPVAEHINEFNKPKTFRDRKKDYTRKAKFTEEELNHPLHQPYKRDHNNLLLEADLDAIYPPFDPDLPPWDLEESDED
jgi:hypothetical protein